MGHRMFVLGKRSAAVGIATVSANPRTCDWPSWTRYLVVACLIAGIFTDAAFAQVPGSAAETKRRTIPILGTTLNEEWEQVGIVAEVDVEFFQRTDHSGIRLEFQTRPGRFSSLAQRSVTQAIDLVAREAHLNTDSWTVRFSLPYDGVTLYGESLSAMAAFSVIALAKNEPIHEDMVMTGTITPEGVIGAVGGIPLKIVAAHKEHFRRVLIPEEQDVADGDWHNPFLMHVSPVKSVDTAYLALTDHPLSSGVRKTPYAVTLAAP